MAKAAKMRPAAAARCFAYCRDYYGKSVPDYCYSDCVADTASGCDLACRCSDAAASSADVEFGGSSADCFLKPRRESWN